MEVEGGGGSNAVEAVELTRATAVTAAVVANGKGGESRGGDGKGTMR